MIPMLPNSNGFRGRRRNGCCAPLSGTLDQRDAGGRAAHVCKADDDLEITQLEHAAADDEHIVLPPSGGNRPGDTSTAPAIMSLLGTFLADCFHEIAVGQGYVATK